MRQPLLSLMPLPPPLALPPPPRLLKKKGCSRISACPGTCSRMSACPGSSLSLAGTPLPTPSLLRFLIALSDENKSILTRRCIYLSRKKKRKRLPTEKACNKAFHLSTSLSEYTHLYDIHEHIGKRRRMGVTVYLVQTVEALKDARAPQSRTLMIDREDVP